MNNLNNLVENTFGHGGIKTNPAKRWMIQQLLPKAQASEPFNWAQGVDNSGKISKIKNQFSSFSCGGQCSSYILEILTGKEISAKSIYAPKVAPGGGMYIANIEGELSATGANLEPTVPSYKLDGTTDEQFMTEMSWSTTKTTAEALMCAGYKSVVIAHDMDSIAHAIDEYECVLVELEGKNGCNWLSTNPLPPVSSNPNTSWYHYLCFVGAGQPLGYQRLKFVNSWGETVGEHGFQYIQSNYLPYILEVRAFYKPVVIPPITPVDVPVEVPLQSTTTLQITHPSNLWVSFWSFILSLFGL